MHPPRSLDSQGLNKRKALLKGLSRALKRSNAPKLQSWNLAFVLSIRDALTSEATLRDAQKGRSGLISKCLEQALLLPRDMQELREMRKREIFLSLKRDLAKVYFLHPSLPFNSFISYTLVLRS